MADQWATQSTGITGPARFAATVTPNDSADLSETARGIYVGGEGDVSVVTAGGSSVTFSAIAAGTVLPVIVARVMATGTTATDIVALW